MLSSPLEISSHSPAQVPEVRSISFGSNDTEKTRIGCQVECRISFPPMLLFWSFFCCHPSIHPEITQAMNSTCWKQSSCLEEQKRGLGLVCFYLRAFNIWECFFPPHSHFNMREETKQETRIWSILISVALYGLHKLCLFSCQALFVFK